MSFLLNPFIYKCVCHWEKIKLIKILKMFLFYRKRYLFLILLLHIIGKLLNLYIFNFLIVIKLATLATLNNFRGDLNTFCNCLISYFKGLRCRNHPKEVTYLTNIDFIQHFKSELESTPESFFSKSNMYRLTNYSNLFLFSG